MKPEEVLVSKLCPHFGSKIPLPTCSECLVYIKCVNKALVKRDKHLSKELKKIKDPFLFHVGKEMVKAQATFHKSIIKDLKRQALKGKTPTARRSERKVNKKGTI